MTSVDLPVPDYEAAIGRPIKGLRVGIPKEYRVDGAPAEIDALWALLVFWLLRAWGPRWRLVQAGVGAAAFALTIELSQLWPRGVWASSGSHFVYRALQPLGWGGMR